MFSTSSGGSPFEGHNPPRGFSEEICLSEGSQVKWTPPGNPQKTSEKRTVGTVTASHDMLILQALSSSRNASRHSKDNERLSGPRKVRQSVPQNSETGQIRFGGVRFQTPNSVSFLGLTEFRGANSVSSSRPIICVPKRTHRVFRGTHRVRRRTQ